LIAGEGISPKTASMTEEMLLNAMHRTRRFSAVGRSDIANLIGFERQKQLAGCSEDTSCAAEIAGALGVGYVASASLGRVGPLTVVSLKIIQVSTAKVMVRADVRVTGEGELLAALDRLVADAVSGCEAEGCFPRIASLPPAAAAPAVPPPPRVERRTGAWGWVLLGLGAASAIGGAMAGWQAKEITDADHPVRGVAGSHSMTQVEAERASTLGLGANVAFGAGALLGVGGAALLVF